MSTEAVDEGLPEKQPAGPRGYRLGYLLKLAQLRLADLTGPALAPYGIDARELAVLAPLAGRDPLSQQQLAGRLGIDRTTMVALVDRLEGKGLVGRRPHPGDRRKNVVELTAEGRDILRGATLAVDDAERRFLAPLTERDATHLRESLDTLMSAPAEVPASPASELESPLA